MAALIFDTLKLAQRLRDEAKFPPEQAEQFAAILSDVFGEWLERIQSAKTASELAAQEGKRKINS
jgi:hypothetical protein